MLPGWMKIEDRWYRGSSIHGKIAALRTSNLLKLPHFPEFKPVAKLGRRAFHTVSEKLNTLFACREKIHQRPSRRRMKFLFGRKKISPEPFGFPPLTGGLAGGRGKEGGPKGPAGRFRGSAEGTVIWRLEKPLGPGTNDHELARVQ